jgi:hypothetical protein
MELMLETLTDINNHDGDFGKYHSGYVAQPDSRRYDYPIIFI